MSEKDIDTAIETIGTLVKGLQELKSTIIRLEQTVTTLSIRIIELEEELEDKKDNTKKVTFKDKLDLK